MLLLTFRKYGVLKYICPQSFREATTDWQLPHLREPRPPQRMMAPLPGSISGSVAPFRPVLSGIRCGWVAQACPLFFTSLCVGPLLTWPSFPPLPPSHPQDQLWAASFPFPFQAWGCCAENSSHSPVLASCSFLKRVGKVVSCTWTHPQRTVHSQLPLAGSSAPVSSACWLMTQSLGENPE